MGGGFWGVQYWGTRFWAPGYWAEAGTTPPPPSTEVERVKPPASFHARRFVAYIPRSFKRET